MVICKLNTPTHSLFLNWRYPMLVTRQGVPLPLPVTKNRAAASRANLTTLAFCQYLRDHELGPFHSPLTSASDFENVAWTLSHDLKCAASDNSYSPSELSSFSELRTYLDALSVSARDLYGSPDQRGFPAFVDPQLTPHYLLDGKPTALDTTRLNERHCPLFSGRWKPTFVDRFLARFITTDYCQDKVATRRRPAYRDMFKSIGEHFAAIPEELTHKQDKAIAINMLNLLIPQSSITIRHQLNAETDQVLLEPEYYKRRYEAVFSTGRQRELPDLGTQILQKARPLDYELARGSRFLRSRALCTQRHTREVLREYFTVLQPNLSYEEFPIAFLRTIAENEQVTSFNDAYAHIGRALDFYLDTYARRTRRGYWSLSSLKTGISAQLFGAFTTHDRSVLVHPITAYDHTDPVGSLAKISQAAPAFRSVLLPINTGAQNLYYRAADPSRFKWMPPPLTATIMSSLRYVEVPLRTTLKEVAPHLAEAARLNALLIRKRNKTRRALADNVAAKPRRETKFPVIPQSVPSFMLQTLIPRRASDTSTKWYYSEPHREYSVDALRLLDPTTRLGALGIQKSVLHPKLRVQRS